MEKFELDFGLDGQFENLFQRIGIHAMIISGIYFPETLLWSILVRVSFGQANDA